MELIPLRIALDTCQRRFDFYGLSFWGDNDLSIKQIVALAGLGLEHPRIRVSTVGRLREIPLSPSRFGAYPHLTIRFEISPTDEQLGELASAFGPPIPNPGRSR